MSIRKKRILYVGDVGRSFSAKYVHACGICNLFQQAGYDVEIVCNGYSPAEEIKEMAGIKFIYTKQYIAKTRLKSAENIIEWGYGPKLWKLFAKTAEVYKPDYVVLYGYAIEKRLIAYCKRYSIPLIVERADWFEKEDYSSLVEKILFYPRSTKAIQKWDKNANGIISISPFFQDYYVNMGLHTVQIPPLFKEKIVDCPEKRDNEDLLKLVYAGSLGGKKDSIIPVIKLVSQINHHQRKIQLSLVGLSDVEVSAASDIQDLSGAGINCYGRVSHDEALAVVAKADFSFLLRENKRYAKAGFSTKFAESMLCGVPVICTRVGGADISIEDGRDGLIIEDNSSSQIKMIFDQLLKMSSKDILTMKKNAYLKGEKLFLSQNYVDKIKMFLDRI